MLYVIQVFSKQNGETPPQSLGTLQVDYEAPSQGAPEVLSTKFAFFG